MKGGMARLSVRGAWCVAALLVAAVPLVAAAQSGFGFRYRNAPYDGRVAMVRARYQQYAGWAYDYPAMEHNLARVLHDISTLRPNLEAANIVDFDDPELFRHPLVYLSEPGYWYPTPSEAASGGGGTRAPEHAEAALACMRILRARRATGCETGRPRETCGSRRSESGAPR